VVNDAPEAKDDEFLNINTFESDVDLNVLENDQDKNPSDKGKLKINDYANLEFKGQLKTVDGKKFKYTPPQDVKYTDEFTFQYKVEDTEGKESNWAKVTIKFNTDIPELKDDEKTVYWQYDDTFDIDVLSNDYDQDGLKITDFKVKDNADLIQNCKISSDGKIISGCESTKKGSGDVIIEYEAEDITGKKPDQNYPARVTLTIANDAPVPQPDEYYNTCGLSDLKIDVLSNDQDRDSISIESVNDQEFQYGTLKIDSPSTIKVEGFKNPEADQVQFNYKISDGDKNIKDQTGTVTIYTSSVSSNLQTTSGSCHWREFKDGNCKIDYPTSVSSVNNVGKIKSTEIKLGDESDITKLEEDNNNEVFIVSGNSPFLGSFSFDFQANTGDGRACVTVYNTRPKARPVSKNIHWCDTEDTINFDTSDADAQDTSLEVELFNTDNIDGTIDSSNNQQLTYISPCQANVDQDSLNYQVNDGIQDSNRKATININLVNDAPTVEDYQDEIHWTQRIQKQSLTCNDKDEIRSYTVKKQPLYSRETIQIENGRFDYEPNPDSSAFKPFKQSKQTVTDTFEYTCSDGRDTSDVASVDITIFDYRPVAQDVQIDGKIRQAQYTIDIKHFLENLTIANDPDLDEYDENLQLNCETLVDHPRVTPYCQNDQLVLDFTRFANGDFNVKFQVSDGLLNSEQHTISGSVDRSSIYCEDFEQTIYKGTYQRLQLDENTDSLDDDTLTYSLVSGDYPYGIISLENSRQSIYYEAKKERSAPQPMQYQYKAENPIEEEICTVTIYQPNRAPSAGEAKYTLPIFESKKDYVLTFTNVNDPDLGDQVYSRKEPELIDCKNEAKVEEVDANELKYRFTRLVDSPITCSFNVYVRDTDQDQPKDATGTMTVELVYQPPITSRDVYEIDTKQEGE
jgi:hypothetical protein